MTFYRLLGCVCALMLQSSIAVSAELYFFHNDHLGTPQALTDKDGNVVWQGEYSPFGEVVETVAAVQQDLRFPGQFLDRETGMHHNYYRDYDPRTGRYMESDPIGLFGGANTYLYTEANPIKNIDEYGLKTCGSGWNEPFVPDNPLFYQFSSCCEAHDNCYGICGMDKTSCDDNFLECLLGKCKKYHPVCQWVARQYHNAVVEYGEGAYSAAQAACSGCDS